MAPTLFWRPAVLAWMACGLALSAMVCGVPSEFRCRYAQTGCGGQHAIDECDPLNGEKEALPARIQIKSAAHFVQFVGSGDA